ncbi:MAG: FKBP-type peptidyl-prolyl cis-trans isomerase [Micrococcales bacterium]|nr:FKBP-type peptidyl-prolyl cis-trans isomerase [Micrococcales bacterium]MCL2668187.1 FKBP-type peptidyl-prolyl cis-trans isomerase [Micrococcales bacterium]
MDVSRRWWAAGLALVLALVALTGCDPAGGVSVEVAGEAGVKPVVTYVAPLDVSSTYRTVIWEGTGPLLVEDRPVLFDFYQENARDASIVRQTYDHGPGCYMVTVGGRAPACGPRPVTHELSRETLGEDLFQTLRGHRAGARLLQVAPASGSGSDRFPSVTVIDVLPLRAQGETIAPRTDVEFPTVTLARDGAPSITPTGDEPPSKVVSQPLIRGTGTPVGTRDTVTFQYTMFTWDGEAVESSWERNQPESQPLEDLPATFSDWFTDQPVGSQFELIVPPGEPLKIRQSEEYKDQTLVLVVDILSTRPPRGA